MSALYNYFTSHINSGDFDLLGFIGSLLGIIGAYSLASYQFRKERKYEKNYSLDMLCCLLNSTISDTNNVIPRFIDVSKYYWEYKIYEPYLENADEFYPREEALIFISNINKDFYTNENTLFSFENVLSQPHFGNLINNFNNDINRDFNFEGLIYDENWYNHLKFISYKEREYREKIIKWIKLLNTTTIEITSDPSLQGCYLNMYNFITLRDEIIHFLKLHNYNNNKLYKEIFKECINIKC